MSWSTDDNVVGVWMNRIQNEARVMSCDSRTGDCTEVSLHMEKYFSYLHIVFSEIQQLFPSLFGKITFFFLSVMKTWSDIIKTS